MTDFIGVQTEIERDAIRLVDRADVRAMVTALAQRWRGGTPGFRPETYAQLGPSIDEVVFLVALQVANSDPRRPRIIEISAGPHSWGGVDVPGGRWGINNPDTTYFAAPIEPGSQYVLRGRPNGTPPIDINISVQTPDVWGVLDNLGREEIAFDADGGFAVTLGDQPPGAGGNHLPLRDGGTVLLIRQTLADWAVELPYDLTIERVGGPDPAPRLSEDELAARLIERLGVVIEHSLKTLQPPILRLPANTIPQPGAPGDKTGYLTAQRSTLSHFRLADDEALILVLSPGAAGYAAVAAPTIWGVTRDSARHQNSLNNRQAVSDPDGRITIIVANVDPGVVNWVDPGGIREGILMLRWQLLTAHPDVDHEPGVSVRHADVADLPTLLPKSLPRIRSAAERREQVTARGAAYARRFTER